MKIELVKISLLAVKAFITWARPSAKYASKADSKTATSSAEPTATHHEIIPTDIRHPSEDGPDGSSDADAMGETE